MAIITGKTTALMMASGVALVLSGCGLTQKVTDGAVAVTQSIFYKQVKTLHLDLYTRQAINSNARGEALSTVVRIYQLKDRKTFDATDYALLFANDSQIIKADLISQKDVFLQPGGAVMVDMPLDKSAEYVAVAAMFIAPNQEENSWRIVLARDELDPHKARLIEAGDNRLRLKPIKEE